MDPSAGQGAVCPADVAHAWRNVGDREMCSLVGFRPGLETGALLVAGGRIAHDWAADKARTPPSAGRSGTKRVPSGAAIRNEARYPNRPAAFAATIGLWGAALGFARTVPRYPRTERIR